MGPLHGLRVIELASIGPGPMCAMLLADLGAEVVRIDRLEPSGLGVPVDTRFDVPGRSRRSIALDLKSDGGREAARRLIGSADVLIEGWRPGVAERLGLGPEDCHARHPGLVYGRMTGYGQSGPLAQTAGHDINYIALTGALHAIGGHEGPKAPVPPLNLVGDYGGGALYLAVGVLAALFERQRSGRGQVVDAAMVDGVGSLMALFHGLAAGGLWDEKQRAANLLDGGAPFYATYETADGGWLAVGALEPKFFAELAQRIGLDARFVQRQYDRRLWPEMREALATLLRGRTRDEWAAVFDGSDACVTPVLSMTEAMQHPQAQQRQSFVEVDGVAQPAPAPRFGRSRPGAPRPAPAIGQHTRELLAEAGYSEAEIATLLAAGSARQTMPA
ncbi:CaiB/BaiF CoA transferase family protein [Ideonella sp.]|uniref:CaiB/BaiF CoA transferase family protein n=1 Tax=Ideonella sp. TaxID=1929293 RepID=UPI0035B0DD33